MRSAAVAHAPGRCGFEPRAFFSYLHSTSLLFERFCFDMLLLLMHGCSLVGTALARL